MLHQVTQPFKEELLSLVRQRTSRDACRPFRTNHGGVIDIARAQSAFGKTVVFLTVGGHHAFEILETSQGGLQVPKTVRPYTEDSLQP